MQWSTAYGIPAAIAVSGGWSLWQQHVRTFRALHYWWVPDSTFIDMLPQQVFFPLHNGQEWAAGDQKTAAKSTYISKMVSSNLKFKAGWVRQFVSNINLELQEVQSLLFDLGSASNYDVACKWLRDNRARWSSWTPPKTDCYEGFGLVDTSGAFVSNRASAVGCGLCQAGTASEVLIDAEGSTFQCKPCPPGYNQSNTYSTQCEPCPSGSSASSSGSATCHLCAIGTYQPDTAQTSCIPCSASQSTLSQGTVSAADCVPDSSNPNPTDLCIFQ
ncbi:unnamed protein product [Durusdinium trenchii]|uniref:Tyrosine-protein kinase ephrin type A/B receptor-like domain-containing protein n=2 Tax=Durusdinium trenchii TaxID=1381693 RepID=A0ABP0IQS7_9DINO